MSSRTWAKLFTKGRTGELRFWQVGTEGGTIIVEHGVMGGATVRQERKAYPKNVGRSNATTSEQQAVLEAEAMHTHKLERKYSLTTAEAQEVLSLPMLATDINKVVNKKVTLDSLFPADVQRKLNGVRAKARWDGDEIVLESRAGLPWTAVPHINEAIKKILPPGSELDGEIYLHGKTLQWITSRAKKAHPDSITLEYHVYDAPIVNDDDSLTWNEREDALQAYSCEHHETDDTAIQWVATYRVNSYAEAKALHDEWVLDGYEGAIVRLLHGIYEFGYRSRYLLKIKVFQDAEFIIVGHSKEEGQTQDIVVWECRNDLNDLVFGVRPRGTHNERSVLYRHASKYYGRQLKVRFFDRTPDGLPFHSVGEAIRLAEDMD